MYQTCTLLMIRDTKKRSGSHPGTPSTKPNQPHKLIFFLSSFLRMRRFESVQINSGHKRVKRFKRFYNSTFLLTRISLDELPTNILY